MGGLFLYGRKLFPRKVFSLQSRRLLHVCIVGSGPAGFYTADKMLKAQASAEVDILDRLPTPFGLVRSGVAPDHPETKNVVNQFTRIAANERFSFFGNVALGNAVSLSELRELYDVVVLAYGAESDRSLGIAGEDLGGVYSARQFVRWYNGHPDCFNLKPDLENTDTAVIFGQGNVALDAARILLRPTEELSTTDISTNALISLQESNIRKVYLVGRRGPAQAACTAKELREILGIENLNVHIRAADLALSPADEEELKASRIKRRVNELLTKAATSSHVHCGPGQRELHFLFFRKPEKFLPTDDGCKVDSVLLEKTCLKGERSSRRSSPARDYRDDNSPQIPPTPTVGFEPDTSHLEVEENGSGRQVAVGTGEFDEINCGLVLKSIGYKSLPVEGLPFDSNRGVVPNIQGRVLSGHQQENEKVEHGLYVAGWLKRGPSGIIATNLYCSEEVVTSIVEDIEKGSLIESSRQGRRGLLQLLEQRNIRFVPFSGWEKIDDKETSDGYEKNKPREKITTWDELLNVAHG